MSAFTFTTTLWRYDTSGPGAWYFVTVPKEYSEEIKARASGFLRGFGSVRVIAEVGRTSWHTSIFPDSKSGSYLLPVKKDIRAKESLSDSTSHTFTISLVI